MREPLSSVDNAWRRMEVPENLMMITGLLELAGAADAPRLCALLDARLPLLPRFRQRVVERGGEAFWEDDPDFDIRRHVTVASPLSSADGGAPGRWVGELLGTPLDHARPLWHMHIAGLGTGSVLVCRFHHSIADGFALLYVALSLTDASPQPAERDRRGDPDDDDEDRQRALRRAEERRLPRIARLARPSALVDVAHRAAAAALHLATMRSDPRSALRAPIGRTKVAAWSGPISLDALKKVARSAGGTLNDVLLGAVSGGLARYLDAHGHPPERLRAVMPVNLRTPEQMRELGNYFGLVFLELPVRERDVRARVAALERRTRRLKRSFEAILLFKLLALAGAAPPPVEDLLLRVFRTKASLVVTNVPGPRHRRFLAGLPITNMMFWVPQSARLGLGVSIFSYAGAVRIGVAADAHVIPQPNELVAAIEAEIEALLRPGD